MALSILPEQIERIGYEPPLSYPLAIEIFRVSDLRRRADERQFKQPHRIEFCMVICVTKGKCRHAIDFEPVDCAAGSALIMYPGQAQQFDASSDWDGWIVLFRPEFLLPSSQGVGMAELRGTTGSISLDQHFVLPHALFNTVNGNISQMHQDTRLPVQTSELHALLRHQLHALLIRLSLVRGDEEVRRGMSAVALRRTRRFHQLLDQHFATWHHVRDYIHVLGCSEKALNRALQEVAGERAKQLLTNRIALEAKRLLAHTALPIADVADNLGFDEPTNFTKFFRREAGVTPKAFREQYLDRDTQTAPT